MTICARSTTRCMSPLARRATKRSASRARTARTSMSAVELLRLHRQTTNPPDFTGKRVVVIGGGNVAMDCSALVAQTGRERKSSIVYRRRKEDMTALPEEVDGATGGRLRTDRELHAPLRIDGGRRRQGLRAMGAAADHRHNRRVGTRQASPRRRKSRCRIACGCGGRRYRPGHRDRDTLSRRACPSSAATSRLCRTACVSDLPGVFAGGDCVTGPATVIRAIAAGKVAAANIDELSRIQPPDFRGCGYSGGHFGG